MAEEPDEERRKKSAKRDLWGKAESLAKILAGVGVIIGSIAIPIIIGKTSDQSHRAQVYMQVMSEREKADTAIRQEMFKTLLTNYLGRFDADKNVRETPESFRRRIMFLDLLSLNFQEYLNARPLFEDVRSRLERAKARERKGSKEYDVMGKLQEELFRVAKNVASRQSSTLALSGLNRSFDLQKGEVVCVRLHPVDNLKELSDKPLEGTRHGSCTEGADTKGPVDIDNVLPAIDVELLEVNESDVQVKVTPNRESFSKGTFIYSRGATSVEFQASYFDTPYMDNTRLFDGSRFALLVTSIEKESNTAHFDVVIFKGDFSSLRDRPVFEEMLKKLNEGEKLN
jgi:hypothetical protein